jgi:hypothetical protein
MAKRKNKLLLSDLFPELAAEREVAEEEEREREREEPARKVQKVRKNGKPMDMRRRTRRSGTPVWRCARNGSGRRGGFRRGTRRTRRR